MKLRPFTWEDVQVVADGWRVRNGNERVSASIKGCSFIQHTFYFDEWRNDALQHAAILLQLTRKAGMVMKRLTEFQLPTDQNGSNDGKPGDAYSPQSKENI